MRTLFIGQYGHVSRSDAFHLLSPAMFLTKICIVGSGSAEAALEEAGERDDREDTLLERMSAVASRYGYVLCWMCRWWRKAGRSGGESTDRSVRL